MKFFSLLTFCFIQLSCCVASDFEWEVYDCDVGKKFVQVALPEEPVESQKEGIVHFEAEAGECRYCLAAVGKLAMMRAGNGDMDFESIGEGFFPDISFEELAVISMSEEPTNLDIATQALDMELLNQKEGIVISMRTVISMMDPYIYVLISQEPLEGPSAHTYFIESFNRRPPQ